MLRVPSWVRRGYAVSVNGAPQQLAATPGQYVTIDRQWRTGDKIEIAMPLTLPRRADDRRSGGAVDLLRSDAPGGAGGAGWRHVSTTGLINVSLYKNFKLTGDFASAMTPVPGQAAALHVQRPDAGAVFRGGSAGGTDAAVPHVRSAAGAGHRVRERRFRRGQLEARRRCDVPRRRMGWRAVRRSRPLRGGGGARAAEWRAAGRLSAADESAIVQAARRAGRDIA